MLVKIATLHRNSLSLLIYTLSHDWIALCCPVLVLRYLLQFSASPSRATVSISETHTRPKPSGLVQGRPLYPIRQQPFDGPGFAAVVFPTVSHCFQSQPINSDRTLQIKCTVKWSPLIQIGRLTTVTAWTLLQHQICSALWPFPSVICTALFYITRVVA
jgi:hypothetical protein